jgi:hypothetical protein
MIFNIILQKEGERELLFFFGNHEDKFGGDTQLFELFLESDITQRKIQLIVENCISFIMSNTSSFKATQTPSTSFDNISTL